MTCRISYCLNYTTLLAYLTDRKEPAETVNGRVDQKWQNKNLLDTKFDG